MARRKFKPTDLYSQLKLTTFEYLWKEKATVLWITFWVVVLFLLLILVASLFPKQVIKITKPTIQEQSTSSQIEKPRLKAPALAGSESSIQAYSTDIFAKASTGDTSFELSLWDIFRLELPSQKFDQSVMIPKYGITKEIPAGKSGVIEFQANISGNFEVYCNEWKKPCATVLVSEPKNK